MNKNIYPSETLTVEIKDLDYQGLGMAEYYHPSTQAGSPGRKLILTIPYTVPGDIVQVTVANARGRKRAHVTYDQLISWGPGRISEWQAGQAKAGGTPLEFMSYPAQLDYKYNLVRNHLIHHDFDPQLVKPVIGMEHPYHYRNKMELTFGANGNLGMHQQGNFLNIIDWQDNLIAPKEMLVIKNIVSQWQKDWQLTTYDKKAKTGLLRNLMMRKSFATQEIMVVIYATESADTYQEVVTDLVTRLRHIDSIASLIWNKNTDVADRTQAEATEVLYGRDYIYDELCVFKYRLWFDTFFQPNPLQAEKLVEIALAMAQVDKTMRILDLFCGVGTFSLPLAARSQEVAGIEIVESSIASAKRNAQDNQLNNTYFLAQDARKGMTQLEETWGTPDLVLLDPPRSGAGGKVMRRIGRLQAEKVVYISCNPKTLAEDLVWLRDFGYEIKEVQPVDQFPHTVHVETIVLMQKVN